MSAMPETTPSTRPVSDTPAPRRGGTQAVLSVRAVTQISPHLLRVTVGGEQFSTLRRSQDTDAYVKLLLPRPGSDLTPPYDLDALRENSPELLPALRTYTVRRWHDAEQSLDIDVVLHDDADGIAAPWAARARVGETIALKGAGGGYAPRPDATDHLLIGDHATLPAIAASLEAMPEDARGHAIIQLEHGEDRIDLSHPRGIEVQWVIGAGADLLEAVQALPVTVSPGLQVFCHAERGLTKQLRAHLVTERGIERGQISISAYWAQGRVEDEFQAEKRQPIGQIDD